MKLKTCNIIISVISIFFLTSCDDAVKSNNTKIKKCDNCLVEKEETAIAIAEAILFERFGKDKIEDEKPYIIKIKQDSIWTVEGSFNKLGYGGAFYLEISSKNGKILEIYHGK